MNMHNASIKADTNQRKGFKPGDRVVCIKKSTVYFPGVGGKEYVVASTNGNGSIALVGEGARSCEPQRFKLVEKKAEEHPFKPGDKVEYKFTVLGETYRGGGTVDSISAREGGVVFVVCEEKHRKWCYFQNFSRAFKDTDLKLIQSPIEEPPFKPGDKFTFRIGSEAARYCGQGPHVVHSIAPRPVKYRSPAVNGEWYVYFGHDGEENQTEADMIPYVEPIQTPNTDPINEATGVLKLNSKPQPFKPGDKVVFKSKAHWEKRFGYWSDMEATTGTNFQTVFTVGDPPKNAVFHGGAPGDVLVSIWTDENVEKAKYCNGAPLAYVKPDLLKHHLEYETITYYPKGNYQTHIVCMYELASGGNIEYLPAANPKVHCTREEAQAEALRLADKHPNKRFMVLSSSFAAVNLPVVEL